MYYLVLERKFYANDSKLKPTPNIQWGKTDDEILNPILGILCRLMGYKLKIIQV
jgi:hypothetical protein